MNYNNPSLGVKVTGPNGDKRVLAQENYDYSLLQATIISSFKDEFAHDIEI